MENPLRYPASRRVGISFHGLYITMAKQCRENGWHAESANYLHQASMQRKNIAILHSKTNESECSEIHSDEPITWGEFAGNHM